MDLGKLCKHSRSRDEAVGEEELVNRLASLSRVDIGCYWLRRGVMLFAESLICLNRHCIYILPGAIVPGRASAPICRVNRSVLVYCLNAIYRYKVLREKTNRKTFFALHYASECPRWLYITHD